MYLKTWWRWRDREIRTRESSQVPMVLAKKVKAWKAEKKGVLLQGKSQDSWRVRTSTENLKCSEAGTDHLCVLSTQTILTARVKMEPLSLLKEELPNLKETKENNMKRSFPPLSVQGTGWVWTLWVLGCLKQISKWGPQGFPSTPGHRPKGVSSLRQERCYHSY